MGASPVFIKSTDSGAPTLSGTAGNLINVLGHCLAIGTCYSTADDVSFADNTTEARLNGGTAFTLWPTPNTTDRSYFGMAATFDGITFDVATAGGGQQTTVWEYWNGSAWTTLSVTDGTTGFTVDGRVSWTIPGSWATTSVNSVTQYWVRVRYTGSNPSANPTVNSASVLGWLEVQTGANQRDYQQGSGSLSYICSINDNGPGAHGGREARVKCFETSTGLGTGTNQFPTTSQNSGLLFIRKSATADATTRTWYFIGDSWTFYLYIFTADTANVCTAFSFGDYYSWADFNDKGRVSVQGRFTEAVTTMTAGGAEIVDGMTYASGTQSGKYVSRTIYGEMAPAAISTGSDAAFNSSGMGTYYAGTLTATPNTNDQFYYLCPIVVHSNSPASLRGKMRGRKADQTCPQ